MGPLDQGTQCSQRETLGHQNPTRTDKENREHGRGGVKEEKGWIEEGIKEVKEDASSYRRGEAGQRQHYSQDVGLFSRM